MKLIAQLTILVATVSVTFSRNRTALRDTLPEDRNAAIFMLTVMAVAWFWLLWEAGTFSELI